MVALLFSGADGTYAHDTLGTRFSLDEPDAIDLTYPVPAKFTTSVPVTADSAPPANSNGSLTRRSGWSLRDISTSLWSTTG